MPAEKCCVIVGEKLKEFGLRFACDIVPATTDGAAVIKKFVSSILPDHQLCLEHGIHLATCDVLYRQSRKEDNGTPEQVTILEEDQEDDDSNEEGGLEVSAEAGASAFPMIREDVTELINKVRKRDRLFRKSPVKNDMILQKHVQSEFGKELQLNLDSKIRWNSLLDMISRFVTFKKCIQMSLIELSSNIMISESEFTTLQNLVNALEPVKVGAEALCRRDSNLLSSDGILKFIFKQLKSQENTFSQELVDSFTKRVTERRNAILVNLVKYLNNPDVINGATHDIFENSMPKRNAIATTSSSLFNRLFEQKRSESIDKENLSDNETSQEQVQQITSLSEELEFSIRETVKGVSPNKQKIESTSKLMLKEMAVFELTKKQTSNLDLLHMALKSIQVTSVETERSFSASGLIVTN